jgi:hypothetical protein
MIHVMNNNLAGGAGGAFDHLDRFLARATSGAKTSIFRFGGHAATPSLPRDTA